MDEKKLQEILTDEAFARSLFELSSAEEVRAALKTKGLELSLDQIEAIRTQLSAQEGEMSGEDLDSVAGGSTLPVDGNGRLVFDRRLFNMVQSRRW